MTLQSQSLEGTGAAPPVSFSSASAKAVCQFRCFEERDWPDLVRFYEQFYRPGYILTDRRLFDWCFHSPLRPDGRSGQRLAVDGGTIVGVMGTIAWPLQVGGCRQIGEFNVNLMVDPAYRGRRIGELLLAHASSGYRYSISSGYTPRSQSLYTRLGRIHHWRMRRLVKVLSAPAIDNLLATAHAAAPVSERTAAFVRERIRESASIALPPPATGMQRILRFHTRWDDVWDIVRGRYGFTTWRDSEFLNWRYVDYPFRLYTCFAAGGGTTPPALIVLRLEHTPFGRIVRIVDLVCAPEAEDQTLRFIQSQAQQAGAIMIDYVVSGGPHEASFVKAGYRELEGDDPEAMPLPMDFAPVRCRPRMLLLALLLGAPGYADTELAANQCYFVKGDGDQDRANVRETDGHA